MVDETDDTQEIPVPRKGRVLAWVAAGILVLTVLGAALVFSLLFTFSRDLPSLQSLRAYDPPQATRVYGRDGTLIARFAEERRTVVERAQIPEIMVQAVIAAEDGDFYAHEGIDYFGILRCVVKNTLAGRKRCGGSTITQQTVKTFLLTPEKTYVRKMKELILAKRMEDALDKDEILALYLNQIYFGHGAYGIQEAARVYFGADVEQLDVPRAALLAGLPKSPSRLDPHRHPTEAKARRTYVLRRMRELGFIDEAARAAADASDLGLSQEDDATHDLANGWYAAAVKQELIARFGEERTMNGGLRVEVGVDPRWQRAAQRAVEDALRAVDKRRGWRGPVGRIPAEKVQPLLERWTASLQDAGWDGDAVWDLDVGPDGVPEPRFRPLREGDIYRGVVVSLDGAAATVHLGGVQVRLPMQTGLAWARPERSGRWSERPRTPSDVLARGDVVDIRPERVDGGWRGVLEQTPEVEGALVAIDPFTRQVRALVGGKGDGAGKFNRALEAKRQPGSTFKPFVYAAAFATRAYTPLSSCLDAPRVYRDPWTGRSWKPENYGGRFDGEITLRRALTLSKNLCSVELIDRVGVEAVVHMARSAGIESPLPKNLTLALGSGAVAPMELTNAYTSLADDGRYAEPILVTRVTAPDGEILLDVSAKPELRIPPAVTFLVTSLMQSVVEEGTARAVKSLGRPIAGKTGTTNDARDAWFVGFTPNLVAGVWVGFDDNRPLGPSETGGRAAIPAWSSFMETAFSDLPEADFRAPSDVVFAYVEPSSNRLAPPNTEGARLEPFLPGTEPTELFELVAPDDRVLWEDYE